ncbi:MAG: phosphopantothenoylcysteine decarboxylase [Gemmataceae bacterium]
MRWLVTAGNTHAPLDRVRVLTNIFSGRTGTTIARTAWSRGHVVTILTSHPELLADMPAPTTLSDQRFTIVTYRTFDDLTAHLQHHVKASPPYDVVVHSAAVSDYLSAGVYAPQAGTYFNARTQEWENRKQAPSMAEQKGGKIKSNEPELWVRLVRAPKLVDRFRAHWGYRGILVKFKLEVGITDSELLQIAEASRVQSAADLMVANTLDGAQRWAYLGPIDGKYERIDRRELAERLILEIEERQRAGKGTWHDG